MSLRRKRHQQVHQGEQRDVQLLPDIPSMGRPQSESPAQLSPSAFSVRRSEEEQSAHVAFGDSRGDPSASSSADALIRQQPRRPGNTPRPSGHFYITNTPEGKEENQP